MPGALFRSPVTVSLPNINAPISPEEKCRLNFIGREISTGQTRDHAIEEYWYAKDFGPCIFSPDTDLALDTKSIVENNFDSLEDLLNSETVILVAFSGGGARAASLASAYFPSNKMSPEFYWKGNKHWPNP